MTFWEYTATDLAWLVTRPVRFAAIPEGMATTYSNTLDSMNAHLTTSVGVAFLGFWTVRTVLNPISGQGFDEGHGESGVFRSARWHDGDWLDVGIRRRGFCALSGCQINSLAASVKLTYSASMVDRLTDFCLKVRHEIGVSSIKVMNPPIDTRSSLFVAKSESE
ncbi:hypothetical protein TNCV_4812211 [Trichonephila clavipes]|nr:hypothetical protein TNCV_4812211 [Trichonephila clavipes]